MTALALYARDRGHQVTGSDVAEDFVTQQVLDQRKFPTSVGFDEKNVPRNAQALIYSAARPENPQIRRAQSLNIPTLSYAQALGQFVIDKKVIAACGVGGKTTTAAMIATILEQANLNPSFVIGVGNIFNFGVPGRWRKGELAVLEADDYVAVPGIDNTPKFLYLHPKVIVVTNIEHDHPDVYANEGEVKKAFLAFFRLLPKEDLLVANLDSKNIKSLLTSDAAQNLKTNVITYGFSPEADWQIKQVKMQNSKTEFLLEFGGVSADFRLSVPGKFNAANAAAATIVATHLGVAQKVSIQALEKFQGTQRRFQRIGSYMGVEVWDDYAHHPNQIRATLNAARSWFPKKKLIVVFQPHTYSRTKALLDDFAQALSLSDEVIITEIYSSAREEEDSSISGKTLNQKTARKLKNCKYIPKDAVLEYLLSATKSGDVVMTLGAGDIYKIAQSLIKSI